MEAETSKVQSLKDCVKHIAVDGQSLDGDGALTWGDTGKATCSVDKSLWTQFFGLFTALVISRDIKRRPIKNVFQETLVFPRQGARLADRLTQWVLHSFVPFYGHLRRGFSFSFYLSYIRRLWHWFRGVKELSTYNIESSRTREIFTTSYYSGYVILRFTFIIITVVTCLLPTVAIAVLAKVNSKDLVLKLITVFTAIFALGFIFFLFFQLKESDLSC
jgi:hypothetical protein